jgi:secondary thiamine-phosphate synthase enzyme
MKWIQKDVNMKCNGKGCYLITEKIISHLPEIKDFKAGMLVLFIKHTTASLTLNENSDLNVRRDMTKALDNIVPISMSDNFKHQSEGPNDMISHVKSSLLNSSIMIPVKNGFLDLGTWQGIYLCEHRNEKKKRRISLNLYGISN